MQTSYKAFELADYPTSEFVGNVPMITWNKYQKTMTDFVKEAGENQENLGASVHDFAREGKDLALAKYPDEYRMIWNKLKEEEPTDKLQFLRDMLTSAWETMDDVNDKALRAIFALRWYVVIIVLQKADATTLSLIKSVIDPDRISGQKVYIDEDMDKVLDELIEEMQVGMRKYKRI